MELASIYDHKGNVIGYAPISFDHGRHIEAHPCLDEMDNGQNEYTLGLVDDK